jgi:5-methylcytosine-specific restriction endonuclease McrA
MAVDCLLYRLTLQDAYGIFEYRSAGSDCSTKIVRFICTKCGQLIVSGDDIQFDHIHADIFDGPHEYQNLRPIHIECHKKKTAQDIKDNSKIKRLTGQRKPKTKKIWPKGKMQSMPFDKANKV